MRIKDISGEKQTETQQLFSQIMATSGPMSNHMSENCQVWTAYDGHEIVVGDTEEDEQNLGVLCYENGNQNEHHQQYLLGGADMD